MQTQSFYTPYNHHKNDHYMIEHDKQLKCICELCSCGKHQCPRKPVKTDFQTSYARQYKKFTNLSPPQQRPSYRYQQRHYSPDVLKSNYQQNFQKQYMFSPQPNMSNSMLETVGKNILKPQVPFVGMSSYKDQFQPYKMIRRPQFQNPQLDILNSYKSRQYRKPQAKFQGISSYKSEFLAPPQPKKPDQKQVYKKPEAPFYGISSYKDQYKPIQINSTPLVYSENPYKNYKTVKFQGKSAYKQYFQPFQMEHVGDSRLSNPKSQCKLDQIVVPNVNYINNKDHVYYDPELKRFL